MNVWLDLETYSEVPIACGTHAYAEGAEVMLVAWAIDDGPVSVWDLTGRGDDYQDVPEDLFIALGHTDGTTVTAHNSHFDRTILDHDRVFGDIEIPLTVWRDTMVQALAHGLPGSLGALCEVMKVPVDQAKDKDGRALVHLFCKPRPASSKIRRATRATHPTEWARFVDYARLDVEAMRAVAKKMPRWNLSMTEIDLWRLDQTINDRGFRVDTDLVDAANAAVARAKNDLAERASDLTGGAVDSTDQRDALLAHIAAAYGVTLPDMQQSTLERRLNDESLPPELRELIAIRLQASATSTSKYRTLARAVSPDGRLRNSLQFDGASRTGRWAGRIFQPQNLPRPDMNADLIDIGIEALKGGCAELIFDDVMHLASNALRGVIIAPPGKKLVVADLSNIEGRMVAWLAGEEWKLDAFRAFDRGDGPDLYKLAYARAFNIDPDDVTKAQRQVGKVMELMLAYGGGVGAFLTGAATYGIDLDAMARAVWPAVPPAIQAEALDFMEWRASQGAGRYGLTPEAFLSCEALKRMWRGRHVKTVALWGALEHECVAAIAAKHPKSKCRSVGSHLTPYHGGAWLTVELPSTRQVCYPGARRDAEGQLTYLGVNPYTRKWGPIPTYGGKLVENVTQAASRDVLAASMPAIEAAGYEIVLTVHDEIITEAPDTPEFNPGHLAGLMTANPGWAEGLPLAAAGFEGYRYRKD